VNRSPLVSRAFSQGEDASSGRPDDNEPPSPAGGARELLLDGATSQSPIVDPDIQDLTDMVADRRLPTPERVSAFRDIIDSEIGDTSLTRVRNIEREVNLRNLYLKFEGGNPTGTQKDRIAFAQVHDALRRGYDTVALATCGNYGASMALACKLAGLKCLVYIPEGYSTHRVDEISGYDAEMLFEGKDYEEACTLSRARAETEYFYDANPGGRNTSLQLEAYAQIAYEIYDELRDAPAAVAVPVSNGTTLAGISMGFQSLYRRCKTSRIPKIIAGSTYRKNPIVDSWIKGYPECRDLNPASIRESVVNEPLINWHSTDGDEALRAIRESEGWAGYVSDKAMRRWARTLKESDGLWVLPASTAGLNALIERHLSDSLPGDRYVAIITGKQS
jgi:threonine synthase